jgi:hypothetical protein
MIRFFFLSFYIFFLEEWKVDLAGFCLLSFSTTAYWAWRMRGHPGKTKNSDINGKRNLKPRGIIALDIGGVFCFFLFSLFSSFFFNPSEAWRNFCIDPACFLFWVCWPV